ncbi:hypothetical protein AB7G19_17115 [Bradyrhizobium sp. 215_C5_N1_1]|uniref:hypothetical protein n=1 Tax=unclassified Bradyrhizobium TaxID=2631580 RepID=UPI003F8B4BCE
MNLRRIVFVIATIAGLGPALAQVPPPVPALPDAERRTSYSITGTQCSCALNFALLGDGVDYQNWVEVWLNGARVNYNDATFGWTITVPTQTLATRARPISDAILTFNNAQTGTVQIVGARRPRRTSQFSESTGVAARDLNLALTDLVAQNRELWDKTNDVTGRALLSQPGQTLGLLPLPSACAGKFLGFNVTGLIPTCVAGAGSGSVVGPASSVDNHFALFNGTTGQLLKDGGAPAASATTDTTNASNITSGTLSAARLPATVPAGPGSSVVGNIAFWNNTSGNSLAATPAYQAGNPGNAALFSQIANPSTLTVSNNALQVSLGTPIPAGQQEGYNLPASPTQSAIVGTCRIGASDTTTHGCLGTAGYAITGSPTGGGGAVAVGMFGQGATSIANASVFGGNTIVTNSDGGAPGGVLNPGQNSNFLGSFEADINIIKLAGGGEPTIGNVFGIGVAGGGTSTTSQGDGFQLNALSVVTGAKWSNGYRTMAGSAVSAFTAGPATTGATTVNSQPITFQGINASGVAKSGTIYGDSNGSIQIKPALATSILDGTGISLIIAQGGLGTAGVQLPQIAGTAGILTNDTSGNLSSMAIAPSTNSIGADVALNNTANYFDGPSVNVGSSGTWFVSGTVTLTDTGSGAIFNAKLWDGATVIASAQAQGVGANVPITITLSGFKASPAGNLRISVKDTSATTGKILFNASGNSKDSAISAYRIN